MKKQCVWGVSCGWNLMLYSLVEKSFVMAIILYDLHCKPFNFQDLILHISLWISMRMYC